MTPRDLALLAIPRNDLEACRDFVRRFGRPTEEELRMLFLLQDQADPQTFAKLLFGR